jgi:hypothetical protein
MNAFVADSATVPAMKTSGCCPKCEATRIYLVPEVQQTYCDAQASLRNFSITSAQLPTGRTGLLGGAKTSLESSGTCSAYICATCGFTEWYMPLSTLSRLERMVEAQAVRVVTADPPSR